jgi:hypothetical protein
MHIHCKAFKYRPNFNARVLKEEVQFCTGRKCTFYSTITRFWARDSIYISILRYKNCILRTQKSEQDGTWGWPQNPRTNVTMYSRDQTWPHNCHAMTAALLSSHRPNRSMVQIKIPKKQKQNWEKYQAVGNAESFQWPSQYTYAWVM